MPGPEAANRGQAGGSSGGAGAAEREEPNRYVPMHLRARDDRQTRADYGDIDKPGGEITDYERHPDLDDAIDEGVALLRNFRSSSDVIGAVKTYIESYMETGRFQAILDPEVDIEQAPQAAHNEPQDDAPISQTHFHRVRTFVNAIEEHYGGHLHNAYNTRCIHDILRKYCNKITTIPGCLLAQVTFADILRLIDMLQHLQQLSMEIKNKIFPEDIIKDKFVTLITQEKYLDDAEELKKLFSDVVEQLRVMISVPHVDLLSFMSNSKSVVTFTIQARLVAKDKVEIDAVKTEDFLHKFDDHEDLKAPLREILEQSTMSQVEFEKLSLLSEKEPGASSLGAVGGADLHKPEPSAMASLSAKAVRTVAYRQTYLNPGEIPPEHGCLKKVLLEDICEGDHIMVRQYLKIDSEKDPIELYFHSFLIGKVEVDDPIRKPGRKIHSRSIEIFEFYKGKSRSFLQKGVGKVYSYEVYAAAIEVDNDKNPKQWSLGQSNLAKTFEEYLNRGDGLWRYTHPDYERDVDIVIKRARAACNKGVMKHHITKNNCEHFVNGCKGLMEGFGWSFQMKSKGRHRYAVYPESDGEEEGMMQATTVPIQEWGDIGRIAEQAADTDSIDSYIIIEDPEMDRAPLPQRVVSNLNIQHT